MSGHEPLPSPFVVPAEQCPTMVLHPQMQQVHLSKLQTQDRERLRIGRLFVGQRGGNGLAWSVIAALGPPRPVWHGRPGSCRIRAGGDRRIGPQSDLQNRPIVPTSLR